jgi:hypothetical protein
LIGAKSGFLKKTLESAAWGFMIKISPRLCVSHPLDNRAGRWTFQKPLPAFLKMRLEKQKKRP